MVGKDQARHEDRGSRDREDVGPQSASTMTSQFNKGQPRKLDDWGSLVALAWGAGRALDYFETDKAVDAKRVGLEGALTLGQGDAGDDGVRSTFAIACVSSSGQSGAKLHRRKYGETIENIVAASEYHWMAGNYPKYAGRWDTLPGGFSRADRALRPATGLHQRGQGARHES